MYSNSDWTVNGYIIIAMGVIVIGVGVITRQILRSIVELGPDPEGLFMLRDIILL